MDEGNDDPSTMMTTIPNHVAARTLWNFTLMSILLFSANPGCVFGKKTANQSLKRR
jgi:hypothetical protein